MRALLAERPGLDGLEAAQVAEPEPKPGEVVIDVEAAGVGHLDLVCLRGDHQLRPAFPFVPGFEVAGRIRKGHPRLEPGTRVAAYVDFGGFAEVAVADVRLVLELPDHVELAQAAALPVNFLTAAYTLICRAEVRPREKIIVHGASGGVGSALVVVASLLGAHPFAVVSDPHRADLAKDAGAVGSVIHGDGWVEEMRALLGPSARADVVVDPVGGGRLAESTRCLRPFGRMLSLGFVAGIPEIPVNRLLARNLTLVGVDWLPESSETDQVVVPWVQAMLTRDRMRPPATDLAPLAEGRRVLERLERRKIMGKAVLTFR